VTVQSDGDLAPGGVGVAGNMFIVGNLTFEGGDYTIDLGVAWDKVDVTGDVTIDFGRLGSESSTGALTGAADRQIISLTGTLTGEFFNAPLGFPLAVGADALQVTNYDSAPTGMTIAQVPGAPGGKASGTDFDGTGYKVTLTGGGDLIVFPDQFNLITIVTRNTTPRSRLVLTTRANASDDLVAIGPVRINGPLAAFTATKANLTGDFTSSGPVNALAVANAYSPITLGGSATDKTALRTETIFSTVTTPGILSAVTTTGDFSGSIAAGGVGKLKIGGSLFGFGQTLVVTNGITSITAARIDGLDLTAKFLGSLTVTGNLPHHISGDVSNSVVRLTGNDGTLGQFGLKTLTAKGLVSNSSILVEEGNVGTVTVGRFFNSQLYVDYTPGGTFNLGGTFDSATAFKLTKFTTTATTIGDPNNELNWAFEGSQVVADTIVSVRLSGLRTDNFGGAFGFKFRTAGGSVQTKTTDASVPLNINLTPGTSAVAGDFFFLDV